MLRGLWLVLVALPFLVSVDGSKYACGMGGDKCSMTRDCCQAHECVEGEWAETTDYVCRRVGEKPSLAQYAERLKLFCERRASAMTALPRLLTSLAWCVRACVRV